MWFRCVWLRVRSACQSLFIVRCTDASSQRYVDVALFTDRSVWHPIVLQSVHERITDDTSITRTCGSRLTCWYTAKIPAPAAIRLLPSKVLSLWDMRMIVSLVETTTYSDYHVSLCQASPLSVSLHLSESTEKPASLKPKTLNPQIPKTQNSGPKP